MLTGLMIPFALLSTACTTDRPRIVLPPADLAECADEPRAPSLPGKDQQVERDALTLSYILALRSAWGDCRSKVDGLAKWRETVGE